VRMASGARAVAAVIGAERFLSEIKTTANLQHPHILPLSHSGEADGYLYYVMPFIDGETLRDKLERDGQLGVEEAVRIARDVADGLDYAHRNDVIHRDIKPANILHRARDQRCGRRADDRDGTQPRDAPLHVAGAGERGPRPQRALGRLQPGLCALRDAGRPAAAHGPERVEHPGAHPHRGPARSAGHASHGAAARGGDGDEVDREAAGGPLRHSQRIHGGAGRPSVHAHVRAQGAEDHGCCGVRARRARVLGWPTRVPRWRWR
jgi:hypothetical protein